MKGTEADSERHFRTDHLEADLKGRSVRGGAVTMAAQAGQFILKLGAVVVLARLLTPEDFGLIAMVAAVTGFITMFKDMGLSMATVQRAEVSHRQVNALFWINVALSVAVMLLTVALAPAVAWFYGEPRLVEITLALAGALLLGGIGVQHLAILKRQMRFVALAATEIIAIIVSITVAVVAAWQGAGYWALVLQQLMLDTIRTVVAWTACRWRPGRPRWAEDLGAMLAFGGNLTGFNVVNYFARTADDLLIGRYVGAGALGLYTKAYQLMLLPLRQINAPIASVMVPTLSRLAGKPEQYRSAYLRALEKISMLTMPGVAFMIMTSDWLIELILGPQWRGASEIFAFLGLAALAQPVANTTGWLFISQNRTRDMFRWGLLGSTLAVLSIIAGLPWGAVGVAASYAATSVLLRTPLLLWIVGRRGPVSAKDQYRRVFPAACAALSVGGSLYVFRVATGITDVVLGLALTLGIALVVTLAVFLLLPSGRAALRHALDLASSLQKKQTS